MISISEYLLSKTNKTTSVSYPELGCDLENIANWIKSFDIEEREVDLGNWSNHNWYYDILSFQVVKDIPGVKLEYRTKGAWYTIILDPTPGRRNASIIKWSGNGEHEEKVSFNKALKITDKVLVNKDDLKTVAYIVSNYKKYLRK